MDYSSDVLMNFRIPKELKSEFQILCYSQRDTMTHRLNQTIKRMVREEKKENPQTFKVDQKHKRPTQWITNLDWRDQLLRG